MENEIQINQEPTETTDGFLEGWDMDATGSAAEQGGETAPNKSSEQQTEANAQAEASAVEQGGEGSQSKPETTGGDAGAENAQQQAETQPKADEPKMWTLRYMDADKQVNESEMIVLAQKGMDYDRIRGKYDESKPVMELFGSFARQMGMSIPDYVSYLRTQAKQASGMSEAEARRAVDLEDREAAVSAREAEEAQRQSSANQAAQAKDAADARRHADIAEFQKLFPDAAKDPNGIPQEVWASVRSGMSLVSAYSQYAVAQAKSAQAAAEQRATAAEQNQRNSSRTTGSMHSAGESTASKDPFMEGWNQPI